MLFATFSTNPHPQGSALPSQGNCWFPPLSLILTPMCHHQGPAITGLILDPLYHHDTALWSGLLVGPGPPFVGLSCSLAWVCGTEPSQQSDPLSSQLTICSPREQPHFIHSLKKAFHVYYGHSVLPCWLNWPFLCVKVNRIGMLHEAWFDEILSSSP